MNKFFSDHAGIWILILLVVASVALYLSIENKRFTLRLRRAFKDYKNSQSVTHVDDVADNQ